MIFLIVLLILILLIFFVPYGVDVSYEGGVFELRAKAGPFRVRIFPRKPLTEEQKAEKKSKREKKKTQKKDDNETLKVKPKKKLDLDFILALLKMGAHAIRRFFKSFSIDFFKLHYTAAGSDPYQTAMQYGYACDAAETLPVLLGDVIHVRRHDVEISSDFLTDQQSIDVRLVVSLQLYKIVHVAIAFGVEFILWKIKDRREKKAAAVSERKDDHGREQNQ